MLYDRMRGGKLHKSIRVASSWLTLCQPPWLFCSHWRGKIKRHRCPTGHPQAAHSCSCPFVCPAVLCTLSQFCLLFQGLNQLGEGWG